MIDYKNHKPYKPSVWPVIIDGIIFFAVLALIFAILFIIGDLPNVKN